MKLSLPACVFSFLILNPIEAAEDGLPVCFFSTEAILNAQRLDPPLKIIKICPGTTINIGLPASQDFTQWANGDFPLTVLHDNVTIQCGDDGTSTGKCVLNGGWTQLLTSPNNPFAPGRKISTNNLKVKGLTFTGSLTDLPGGFASASVGLGAPGTGMVFEDIIWENMDATEGLYLLKDAISSPEDHPPLTSDLTVKDSFFRSSSYGRAVFLNIEQTMHLENVGFEDLTYKDCGCSVGPVVSIESGGAGEMKDCSFDNVEIFTSLVYILGSETDFKSEGNSNSSITVYDKDNRNATEYCEAGLAFDFDPYGSIDECIELNGSPDDDDDDDDDDMGSSGSSRTVFTIGAAIAFVFLMIC